MRVGTMRAWDAFMGGKRCKPGPSLWTDGQRIFSYGTPILSWNGDKTLLRFNINRYSVTTSTHQNGLRELLRKCDHPFIETDDLADMR